MSAIGWVLLFVIPFLFIYVLYNALGSDKKGGFYCWNCGLQFDCIVDVCSRCGSVRIKKIKKGLR